MQHMESVTFVTGRGEECENKYKLWLRWLSLKYWLCGYYSLKMYEYMADLAGLARFLAPLH